MFCTSLATDLKYPEMTRNILKWWSHKNTYSNVKIFCDKDLVSNIFLLIPIINFKHVFGIFCNQVVKSDLEYPKWL